MFGPLWPAFFTANSSSSLSTLRKPLYSTSLNLPKPQLLQSAFPSSVIPQLTLNLKTPLGPRWIKTLPRLPSAASGSATVSQETLKSRLRNGDTFTVYSSSASPQPSPRSLASPVTRSASPQTSPPNGVLGSAHTVVQASSYGIDEGYLSNYEDELLIMCQVECGEAVKKIKEIAAVKGVACIQMGPLDLSASLGYLWDPGYKKVKEVMRAAEKAVLEFNPGDGEAVGAYLAGFAMPHDSAVDLKSRGYHMVSEAVDVGVNGGPKKR